MEQEDPSPEDAPRCSQCGAIAPGKRSWRVYRALEKFPDSPVCHEFNCFRCIRRQRIYGIAALLVFLGGIATILIAMWVLSRP